MTRADDFARGGIERGVEAGQAIPSVIMRAPLRETGAHRKQRLRAAQGLNLGFLVHAEHDRVRGRVQVQADHVVNLGFHVGVLTKFEGLGAMWLQRMRPPDAVHGAMGDADLRGQIARTPVGEAAGGWFQRQGHNLRGLPFGHGGRSSRSGLILQPGEAGLGKPPTDPTDLHGGIADLPRDFGARHMLGHQQHRPRPACQAGGGTRRPLQPLQLTTVAVRHDQRTRAIGHVAPFEGDTATILT
jgi:hypothetical protein